MFGIPLLHYRSSINDIQFSWLHLLIISTSLIHHLRCIISSHNLYYFVVRVQILLLDKSDRKSQLSFLHAVQDQVNLQYGFTDWLQKQCQSNI